MLSGIEIREGFCNFAIHIFYCFENPLSEIAFLIAVAQFDGFVFAGGGAAGNGSAAHAAIGQLYLGLYGRIAAGIKNLASANLRDIGHM